MSGLIATSAATFSQIPAGLGTGVLTIGAAELNVKAGNSGVYTSPLSVTLSAYTIGTLVQTTPASGTITSSVTTKANGKPVICVGDSVTLTVPVTDSSSGTSTTTSVVVKITDAGQSGVKVE